MKNFFRLIGELGKARISLLAALSAALGHVLAADGLRPDIWVAVLGTILLALGASSLNEYQERKTDALMARTRVRPIPSGRITPTGALAVSFAEILAGSALLVFGASLTSWALGLFAVLWYNGLYTPLKRVTAFAVIPGSLIGAIPPVIGWTAAGGSLKDPRILAVAFFFFIWQVPHFWLLLFRYGKEYQQAGFPSVTGIFREAQLARITFIWILATAVSCLFMPLFGAVRSYIVFVALIIASLRLVVQSSRFIHGGAHPGAFRTAFRDINLYALLVIVLASADPYL